MRLSVIFPDSLILKDGEGYTVDLTAFPGLHAIQWNDGAGWYEYAGGRANEPIEDEAHIEPFLTLWQAAYDAAHPAPTWADRVEAVRAQIDAKTLEVFAGGFTVPSGTLAGKNLQVRNETDRTNWLTSLGMYQLAIANGQGAEEGAIFRTTDNQTFTLTYAEGLQVLVGMMMWGRSVYGRAWALKDQLDALQDGDGDGLAVIRAVHTHGWPN